QALWLAEVPLPVGGVLRDLAFAIAVPMRRGDRAGRFEDEQSSPIAGQRHPLNRAPGHIEVVAGPEVQFGELDFRAGDYLYMPRGTIQRMSLAGDRGRLLIFESAGSIATPHRYRNGESQVPEHAPHWERDFGKPEGL